MATLLESLTYQPIELSFGTSGLRGLVKDITDLEAYINSAGFLRFLAQTDGLTPKAVVYIGGDLRHSTPRIMAAVYKAITDNGYQPIYCGLIPTPALAYFGLLHNAPCIMVTGSHIPDDRNGIKFYKAGGEVLKEDEFAIREAVLNVRNELYASEAANSGFTPEGMLEQPPAIPAPDPAATTSYFKRYTDVFDAKTLAGKKVVLYQHSAVGRDMLLELLEALGAQVVPVGRSDSFVSIDSENVTPDDQAYFKVLVSQNPGAFAIVSTDGDSDRPFVIDETGVFHRGDELGAVVADWLKADFAAFPISASDGVDQHLTERKVPWQHTKIGSPYVIAVMDEALRAGRKRVVGWEVNGGFLLGCDITMHGKTLRALPTRDAVLPIIGAMIMAVKQKVTLKELFAHLPTRFSQGGLLDNFPNADYKAIAERFSPDTLAVRDDLAYYFGADKGFGQITKINTLDGIRIYFDNGEVAHLRQSNNAPQLRIYSLAATQERADAIVAMAVDEQNGIFRAMQNGIVK